MMLIKRRQLLKNACATAAIVGTAPAAFGAELENILFQSKTVGWQRVKLNKGETISYIDPVSGRRQQVMAVTNAIQVDVPQTPLSCLPVAPRDNVKPQL